MKYFLRCTYGGVAALVALCGRPAFGQWVQQSVDLVIGWNSVYLEVDPWPKFDNLDFILHNPAGNLLGVENNVPDECEDCNGSRCPQRDPGCCGTSTRRLSDRDRWQETCSRRPWPVREQLVALELTLSGWGPEELEVYQSFLDCATFDSADEGVLVPVTELCNPAQGGPGYDGTFCMGVDVTREDYALAEASSSLPACAESGPCPNGDPSHVGCGSVAISGGGTDTGSVDYGAVFAVDVPVGASGTFVLGLDPAPKSSFMRDSMDQFIEPLTFSPAVIMMGSGLPLIEPNDLVFGLSNSSGSDSMEQVRGPAVANGGTAVPDFWDGPFIQSVEFDNLDFILHNPAGNLLGVDFGTEASGGSIWSFATTIPEPAGQLIGNTTGLGGGGLTPTRLGGLSISPDNTKIAVTGSDSARVIVFDYTAGDTMGFGASLSGARESEPILCALGDVQGTTWVNEDFLLAFSSTGEIFAVDPATMASFLVATVDVGLADPCGQGFTDIEFNPFIVAPVPLVVVYAMYGGFSDGVTTNKLAVLGPAEDGLIVLETLDYSSSMDTTREIALGSDGNLFVSQFGGAIDVIPDADDLASLSDNNSIDWYTSSTFAAFSGIDVALEMIEFVPEFEPGTSEAPLTLPIGCRNDTGCTGCTRCPSSAIGLGGVETAARGAKHDSVTLFSLDMNMAGGGEVYGFSGEYTLSGFDLGIPGRCLGTTIGRKYRSRVPTSSAQGNGWGFQDRCDRL